MSCIVHPNQMRFNQMQGHLYITEYLRFNRDFNPLSILSADMQKFPLRMKDNDLLVTELYKDNTINDHITAISVYLTPKITSKCR